MQPELLLDLCYSDSTVFDVFTFQFIRGEPRTALRNPNSVVLTESIAGSLFSNTDPIGKFIEIDVGPNGTAGTR